ncbi:hypothetical protein [Clostridium sp. FS41]|uniref:hypothetical protein n=1 Tax=Clostridium sp. FS41 TaxID=1609975 RepID=UPI00061EF5A8|nr:hypothetical protein [Clostridium sp. FS41]KJJ71706.1 hypothetical protein CLFS41_23680 [Clostridium sp. FS41]
MTFPIDIEEYTRDKMKLLEDPDMGDYAVFRAMAIFANMAYTAGLEAGRREAGICKE